MKVLFYTHSFAPNVGGQETIVMLQAQGLARTTSSASARAVELTLATPTPRDGMDDAILPFRVVRQPNRTTLFHLVREADMVHLAGPILLPMSLALLLRKPIVVEHHGFQTVCPNGQLLYGPEQSTCPGHFMARRYGACLRCNTRLGKLRALKMWLLTFLRRWMSQRVTVNVLPTAWLGTVLQLNRMETIVHGLPSVQGAPSTRPAPPLPIFAFVGRLVSTKGIRVLLEAAQLLKSRGVAFQVSIIGEGAERDALEKSVRDLGIERVVTFMGHVPSEKLDEVLANATAVVMPSVAGEVFGMVAAENMQQGRLVIVSNIGSLSEVVGNAGMKVGPGDAVALANCMETAIKNPRLREEVGRKASERILQFFSADQMIEEHLRVYEGLCRAR
jgi:glycosyltransferase involved in cell wall biosynthesis